MNKQERISSAKERMINRHPDTDESESLSIEKFRGLSQEEISNNYTEASLERKKNTLAWDFNNTKEREVDLYLKHLSEPLHESVLHCHWEIQDGVHSFVDKRKDCGKVFTLKINHGKFASITIDTERFY